MAREPLQCSSDHGHRHRRSGISEVTMYFQPDPFRGPADGGASGGDEDGDNGGDPFRGPRHGSGRRRR
eukprot:9200204-Pyramimonas_sp.AAC.1